MRCSRLRPHSRYENITTSYKAITQTRVVCGLMQSRIMTVVLTAVSTGWWKLNHHMIQRLWTRNNSVRYSGKCNSVNKRWSRLPLECQWQGRFCKEHLEIGWPVDPSICGRIRNHWTLSYQILAYPHQSLPEYRLNDIGQCLRLAAWKMLIRARFSW